MRIFKWKKLVSLMLAGVFCGSAVGASAFADEDGKGQPPAKPAAAAKIEAPAPLTERERQLLDRVEQLEKRMAELEGKAQPTGAVPASTPAGSDSSSASMGTAGAGPAAAPSAASPEPASPGVAKTATAARVEPQAMEKNETGPVK